MTDGRRLTTDRFYGGTGQRLQLLQQLLSFLVTKPAPRSEVKEWILRNTPAESRDAIDHHLGFLDSIEFIDIEDGEVTTGWRGNQYLESPEPSVLYGALRANVIGFDSILQELLDGPMTDEDIMRHLKEQFEDVDMDSPGVAARHREWLQVLDYVDRSEGVNRLTDEGHRIATEKRFEETTDREKVRILRSRVLQNDMKCVSAGRQAVSDGIYDAVKGTYPDLCDDDYLCSEAHDAGRESPEWKHVVQEALQQLADDARSRVRRDKERGKWIFLPRFKTGETYQRKKIHDQLGGQRQRGISPCRTVPVVLLFSSFSKTDEGYVDSMDLEGVVTYTGEGTEGDMTFDHGNRAIRDHQDEGVELHLFRALDEGRVQYIGQYECMDWFREDMPDVNGEVRDGIRFELWPVNDIDDTLIASLVDDFSEEATSVSSDIRNAKCEDVSELPEGKESVQHRRTVRETVERNRILVNKIKNMYNDRCQVCGERRRQGANSGYSEVHHIMPLQNDGPDKPENIVVLCPNHHLDFENGMLTVDPQSLEISHSYESHVDGRNMLVAEGHAIGAEYLAFHNMVVANGESG